MSWGQYGVRPLGQGRRENLALVLSFLCAAEKIFGRKGAELPLV